MKLAITSSLKQELITLNKKQRKLAKKIQKQLKLFKEDHRHPSLRNHKLKGNLSNNYSISIEGNIRMIYYIEEDTAIFYSIGTHEEVYRK